MFRKITLVAIIFISGVLAFFIFLYPKIKYPHPGSYHGMNVTPVSGSEETKKYGFKVGGWCWLGGAATILKYHDPSITFDKVLLHKEGGTSFTFYFPSFIKDKNIIVGNVYRFSTESQMLAAKNLGYRAHLRIRDPLVEAAGDDEKWQIENWIKFAKEMRADVKTFIFPSINEIKHLVSNGSPVFTGAPCGNDLNVIEGYTKSMFNFITPEPFDAGLTGYKSTCKVSFPYYSSRVIWYTKDWEAKSDQELVSRLKWHAELSSKNMRAFAKYIEQGYQLDGNSAFNQTYIQRRVAADYFDRLGYKELAGGYNRSAQLLRDLNIKPDEQNRNRAFIAQTIKKVADIEEGVYKFWPSPIVEKETDFLEYGGLTVTAGKKTKIAIVSHQESVPEGKLVYEVYNIQTSAPLTLTFPIGVYAPANLYPDTLQIVKLENSKAIKLETIKKADPTNPTISAQINSSGKYALISY